MASYQHNRYIGDVAGTGNSLFDFGSQLSGFVSSAVPGTIQDLIEASKIDKQQKAGIASARMGDEFAKQRDAVMRNASRMGVNPNSGRFRALQDKWAMAEAAARAGASTKALEDAEAQEFARDSSTVNILKSLGGMGLNAMSSGGGLLSSAMSGRYNKNAQDFTIDRNVQTRRGEQRQKRKSKGHGSVGFSYKNWRHPESMNGYVPYSENSEHEIEATAKPSTSSSGGNYSHTISPDGVETYYWYK